MAKGVPPGVIHGSNTKEEVKASSPVINYDHVGGDLRRPAGSRLVVPQVLRGNACNGRVSFCRLRIVSRDGSYGFRQFQVIPGLLN